VLLSPDLRHRRLATATVLLLTAGAYAGARAQSSPQSPLVIRNVGVLSMLSPDVERGTVVVRGDRITYVGGDTGIADVPGARIVDGTGRYLIPGLMDLHTHVSKTRASSLGLLAAHGVTTVRDLGGDHEELLRWKEEVKSGTRIGPRLLIAGPYLESARNASRQHGTPLQEMIEPVERTRVGVATPEDAARIVDAIAARGVDHLKIRTVQDRQTYFAIGAAARRHGLALAGHFQPYSFDDLFASGQRSIEHGFYPPLDDRAPAERTAVFTRLSTAGVMVVPTLVVLERLGSPDDGALKAAVEAVDRPRDGRRLLSAYLRADWREQLAEQGADRRRVYGALHASARRDLAGMRAAGVRILAGTDVGVLNVFPGRSIHEELALLVRDAGMTPLEALQAATLHAAAGLGLERELGSIEAGKVADLVLIEANPLADITRVSQIAGVVLRGRYFDRPALDGLLDQVAASPDVAVNDWPRAPKR
jgi:imidazolonepropionase-like amidohydrolase